MKKIILPVLIGFSIGVVVKLFSFFLGESNREMIEKIVSSRNSECPVQLDPFNTLLSYTINKDTLEFNCEFSEEVISSQIMRDNKALFHDYFLLGLQKDNEEFAFNRAVADEGMFQKFIYQSNQTKEKISILISPSELKKAISQKMDPKELSLRMLKVNIDFFKLNLSIQVAEGMTISNMELKDDVLEYTVIMDENLYDVDEMERNKEQMKADAIPGLLFNVGKGRIESLIQCNKGLLYLHKGNKSGKVCSLLFTVKDLQQAYYAAPN